MQYSKDPISLRHQLKSQGKNTENDKFKLRPTTQMKGPAAFSKSSNFGMRNGSQASITVFDQFTGSKIKSNSKLSISSQNHYRNWSTQQHSIESGEGNPYSDQIRHKNSKTTMNTSESAQIQDPYLFTSISVKNIQLNTKSAEKNIALNKG